MTGKLLFDEVSYSCSRYTTHAYSTSFSLGIKTLHKDLRDPIYAIYGFVRFADEIVDTFHEYNKENLMARFRQDTVLAIHDRISLNPILNSFQQTFHTYNIEWELVDTFLKSMEMDLNPNEIYDREKYETYILGSAEVVGLMCLHVFVKGNKNEYERLKPSAMRLGSAFQKINFLRDLQADYSSLGRTYFPNIDLKNFSENDKKIIEAEIAQDFAIAYKGILELPKEARFGVLIAYKYYINLFYKIQSLPSARLMKERIRVPNQKKMFLLAKSFVQHNLNML
ncbi:MAG: phytoene/squalene synthase family protein [Bacteroidota bacterium]